MTGPCIGPPMALDDGRDGARIDGLLASFGEIMAVVGRLDERASAHDREFRGLREQRAEDLVMLGKALETINKSCGEKVDSVKSDLHHELSGLREAFEQAAAQAAKAAAKAEAKRERNTWTLSQKIAVGTAAFAGIAGVIQQALS
jgi:hypothetical protein